MSRGFGTFRGEASIKAWAFTVAARVATDYFGRPEN